MLSTKYRVRLTDICCRIISDDTVTIEERMWMNKLCEHNQQAKASWFFICPDLLGGLNVLSYYEPSIHEVWVRKEYLTDHKSGHGEFVKGLGIC